MTAVRLGETQRRLWRLVTAPEGIAAGLSMESPGEGRTLAGLIQGDARLGAMTRLTVYANAYFYRIRDALKEDFGGLHQALEEVAFHNLVTAYLVHHPPTHPSLRYAGKDLPGFLARHPEASVFRDRCPWAADLAALEWALLEAFDAPDGPTLTREELAAVPPEDWGGLRFSVTKSLQLLTLAWPVQKIREAYDGKGERGVAPPAPAETKLRVWRKDERVYYRPMTCLEADALTLLVDGATFGRLCERVATETGQADAPPRAVAILNRWLDDKLLASLRH